MSSEAFFFANQEVTWFVALAVAYATIIFFACLF
jgi:hypothetical protein